MENITVETAHDENSVEIVRVNITMPKQLRDAGARKAQTLCFTSLSAYFQDLVRTDCGMTTMARAK